VQRNENKNKVIQQLVTNNNLEKKSSFHRNLCKALLSSNISLNKLLNKEFEKYTNDSLPNKTTLK